MKSYTDIEQSYKLTKILPIESADMRYNPFGDLYPWVWNEEVILLEKGAVPCWSLATLLKILHRNEKYIVSLSYGGYKDGKYILNWCLDYETENGNYIKTFGNDSIDACVEMIIKLHELNLL